METNERNNSNVISEAQAERQVLLREKTKKIATELGEAGIMFVPYAGDVWMIGQGVSGKTASGRVLSGKERTANVLLGVGSLAANALTLGLAGTAVKDAVLLGKIGERGLVAGKSASALAKVADMAAAQNSAKAIKSAEFLKRSAKYLDSDDMKPFVSIAEQEFDRQAKELLEKYHPRQKTTSTFSEPRKSARSDFSTPASLDKNFGTKRESGPDWRQQMAKEAVRQYGPQMQSQGLYAPRDANEPQAEDFDQPGSVRSLWANRKARQIAKNAGPSGSSSGLKGTAKTAAIAGAVSSVLKGQVNAKDVVSSAGNWAILAVAFSYITLTSLETAGLSNILAVLYLHLHWHYLGPKRKKIWFFEFQPFTLMQKITVGALDAIIGLIILAGLAILIITVCTASLSCTS